MAARGSDCLFTLLFCIISSCAAFQSIPPNPKTSGEPWPMPLSYKTTTDTLYLNENFKFSATGKTCDILEDAFERYFKYIFYAGRGSWYRPPHPDLLISSHPEMTSLAVDIANDCVNTLPTVDMDESYVLRIVDANGLLKANTIWGALRGLETFSQLIHEDHNDQFLVNVTVIQDKPRFSWRGVLLDTSRHYLAKEVILQNLDAMAINKMNVFHWHMVDAESFPYQSKLFPGLSDAGAYYPYTHIYTQDDIKDIIEYARRRGIRVVAEFDTPGHTQSWGNGQPNLLTKCYKGDMPSGHYGPIDPTLNTTWSFLKTFMGELAKVFPDNYLHLGGDEVSFSCWRSNPRIQEFMTQHGLGTDYSKLEDFYMQKLINIVKSYHKGYLVWQEVFDNGVKISNDTIVHVWKGGQEKELARVTARGYHTILSSCWYLNRISFGSDWTAHYKCDPQRFNGTVQQRDLVIGGELCMWGEFVDGTNLISRTWPRGCAVAERLWSSQDLVDPKLAKPRLEEQRCRMIRRGLNAEPVNGPGVCKYEYQPKL